MTRHAGVLMPLFSAASSSGWGIGEFGDVATLATWLSSAGFNRLMLLPLGAMAAGQSSPYSAMSAMALDPIYIGLARLDDFVRLGGAAVLGFEARMNLEAARARLSVGYENVRRAKDDALRKSFDRFVSDEWGAQTQRAAALSGYIARERAWLDDYALYCAISEELHTPRWRDWPAPLRDRDGRALDEARHLLARDIIRHQYVQWVAESEWQHARAAAREAGVALFGDLTFAVETDSVDVWTRQEEFALDVSAGAPPDAFSETGQDWQLPMYRWETIAASDYAWLRQRAQRMAALFDGIRVDHVVGFYRTYGKPAEGDPFFLPAGEADQLRQGEAIMRLMLESGAMIIAEDLGTVPDFVRVSLAGLGIPGSKVLRWERGWDAPAQPFIDPRSFPSVSATMTSTHDTEPLAVWWENSSREDRVETIRLLLTLDDFQRRGVSNPDQPWNDALRDALLEIAYRSGSSEVFVTMQDMFGWRDRINVPGLISDTNWTWRLPWPVDRLATTSEAIERAEFWRQIGRESGPKNGRT